MIFNDLLPDVQVEWKSRWFGFPAEETTVLGRSFKKDDLIVHDWNKRGDLFQILEYMRSCTCVLVPQLKDKICEQDDCHDIIPNGAILSDGIFLWPADICHYVEKHDYVLPKNFLDYIRSQDYKYEKYDFDISSLDWPSSYRALINK